jgi:hypothetical protein
MNGRMITAKSDVRGQFVHFTADGKFVAVRSAVWEQRKTVFARLRDVDTGDRTERSIVVEPGFDDGGAGSSHSGMTLPIRNVAGSLRENRGA